MCTCVGLEMKNFVCEGIRALVSKSTLTGLALGSRATNSRSAIYTQGSTFRLRSVSPLCTGVCSLPYILLNEQGLFEPGDPC